MTNVEEKIQETFYHIRKIDDQLGKNISRFMRKTAANKVNSIFGQLNTFRRNRKFKGINAGHIRNQQGVFPSDTIFSKVEERFTKMYESIKKVNN